VKCLEYDIKMNALRESSQCRYTTREPIYRTCNAEKCEGGFSFSLASQKLTIFCILQKSRKVKLLRLNGDNAVSESGSYEAVGAVFDYHRIDGAQDSNGVTEWITSVGPIRDSLQLMV